MSDAGDALEKATEIAAKNGLVVVQPEPNELFVDIDDDASFQVFRCHWPIVQRQYGGSFRERPSPSRKPHRRHLYVTLDKSVDNAERITLQALLGSDRLHELLSWNANEHGNETPTLFFERPEDLKETDP